MTELNDLIALGNGQAIVCTEIKREGMPLYAIILVHKDDTAEVLRTFMDKRIALTALHRDLNSLQREINRKAIANLKKQAEKSSDNDEWEVI